MIRIGAERALRAILAAGALAVALPVGAATAARGDGEAVDPPAFAPGQLVVGYEPGTSRAERADARDAVDARLKERLAVPRTEVLSLAGGPSVKAAVAELEALPGVEFAEPNFIYRLATTPDDTDFAQQWPLDNLDDADIDAPEAWGTGQTGSEDVVVGVVDSGIDLTHPDLDDNIWVNQDEAAGSTGVDDDGNGFTDDVNGWNFAGYRNANPSDVQGHGTHVAGIIGAEGNNSDGIAGINWDVSLMPLRACNAIGSCLSSDVADAYTYAAENGAGVVNASLSGSGFSQVQESAIADAPNTLFVVAAGNEANNDDASARYPCSYQEANLICVAATNISDGLASYSNYGPAAVDLAAPGGQGSLPTRVLSTYSFRDLVTETFSGPFPAGSWSTGGDNDTWGRTTELSATDPWLADSPGASYENDTDSWAQYGPVDLSAYAGCRLQYSLLVDVPDAGDALRVEASADGAEWEPLQAWNGTGATTQSTSLFALNGSQTAYFRFRLTSDASVTGDGAYLDDVLLRCPEHRYERLQGTSMATPHVAGAAALMLAENPSATVADLREWLIDGVDLKPELQDRVGSGGRLNLFRSLRGAAGEDIDPPDTSLVSRPPLNSRSTTATFGFESDEAGTFECSRDGASFAPCSSPLTLKGLAVGTHDFRVAAIDGAGNVDTTPAQYGFTVQPPDRGPCLRAKAKLRGAKTKKQRKKLRKLVRRKCATQA